MSTVQWPDIETADDKVGGYNQDAINGFSDAVLDAMLGYVDPGNASHVLDAMAGNGNLTSRLYDYCRQRGLPLPPVEADGHDAERTNGAIVGLGAPG